MCQVLRVLAVLCVGSLVAGVSPAFGAFPGANGRIAFDSFRDGGDVDIWTMRPDGRDPINLTANSAAFDARANWRADGRKLVFMSDRVTASNPDGIFQIFVMNADGSDPTQITFSDVNHNSDPAWSPDGRKIVFVRQMIPVQDPDPGVSNHDVWTMNADGSNQRDLTNSPAEDQEPNWAPNGRKIAFTSDRTGSNEVYTFNPNGSRLRQLTSTPGFDGSANWSPDSRTIAFDSERDGNSEIYKMRADGSHPVNLTRNPALELVSAWSPDGRKVAFTSDRDASAEHPDNFEVYTMRADGSRQTNLTNNPAFDFGPDWQPRAGGHDRDGGAQ